MTTNPMPTEPSPELKQRVLAAVRDEPALAQDIVRRRTWILLALSIGIVLAIFVQFGGVRRYDRPVLLVLCTCLGWSAAATAAASIGVARGRSMLGRSTASLLLLVVALPLALLAWKIGVTFPFGPEMRAGLPGRLGVRCLGLSLAMAAPLLMAFVMMRRRSDPVHPGLAGAALGVTAGVVAGTLVDLWCPIAYLPHVLLGHILPLLIAAMFGAWAGRRFVAL